MYFKSLYRSFYVRAGKNQLYVKCFENGNWITINPEVGINEDYWVTHISVLNSNLNLNYLKNGEFWRRINPLNHERVILSDFEIFEITLRATIKALVQKWFISTNSIVFELGYDPIGGVTETERRQIRDSLEHSGARNIYLLIDHDGVLPDDTISQIYKKVIQVSERQRKKFFNSPDSKYLRKLIG